MRLREVLRVAASCPRFGLRMPVYMSFLAELKRRHVFKVAAAHVVAAWVLAWVYDIGAKGVERTADPGEPAPAAKAPLALPASPGAPIASLPCACPAATSVTLACGAAKERHILKQGGTSGVAPASSRTRGRIKWAMQPAQ